MELILGNSKEKLRNVPENSIDSIVCDPPYELNFMGKAWDNTGIAYDVELWKECLRVLKPGGHLLSFGGTRTYHRMACAIEDAGFEIRDQIQWIFGTGFPKSHDISKAINKINGVEFNSQPASGVGFMQPIGESIPIAKKWSGWGTALKPANEPVCLARKPIGEKTVALNVLKWGTGGLNIDATRIELNGEVVPINKLENWSGFGEEICPNYEATINDKGRFPANLILDEEAGQILDEQSGISKTRRCEKPSNCGGNTWGGTIQINRGARGHSDLGGASRFFYCAKTNKKEKSAGLDKLSSHITVKPISLMRYLCKLVTPKNGLVLDPFMGSGSTGIGAINEGFDFVGIEKEKDYFDIAKQRITYWKNLLDN